ncbi:hypothetical protein JCM30471_31810 [Desulfuromonas carbonis]|uniref:ATP-binding protein n=1 Tax=Desulfuromonas sp. DDH964 TaxID=1823759 RepID=UPI00078D2FE9|nr:ATP-binding protein [Desulfuromonas sp. DDH964]AMV71344.1 response receiver histidine kinase [Desulfuromonas sp. DDH964]
MVREPVSTSDPRIPRRLQRKIVSYTIGYTLIALILVAALSIFPLRAHLRESAEANLQATGRIRAVAIGEYVSRLSDIARQITSRSAIRNRLAAFYAGEVSRAELVAFTRPKLADALHSSVETLGIIRLDVDGQVVVRVGQEFPASGWELPADGSPAPVISGPVLLDDAPVLVVAAPIIASGERRLGTDLVLFATTALQQIVQAPDALGQTGSCMIGEVRGEEATILFPGRFGDQRQINQPAATPGQARALQQAARGESGRLLRVGERGRSLLAYAPIPATDWGLLVTMDQRELFAEGNRELAAVGLAALLLSLCGGTGIFFLLHPLTNRLLAYSESMAELNADLQQEIEGHSLALSRLRRSEQEWAQTFESITDAVAIVDTCGEVTKINRAAAAIRKKAAEAGVSTVFGCRVFPGLQRYEGGCPFERLMDSKHPEYCTLHQQESNQDFLVSVFPVLDPQGELQGAVHIARDITRQKQMERLKDEMISSVSHEMRTPLTAILGFLEFILEYAPPPEQQRDCLQTAYHEAQRLNDLVSNFLDLQRLKARLESCRMEPLAIAPLLAEASRQFPFTADKHPIEVVCPDDLPMVFGDAYRIGQILKNLLVNAIRFSPKGGRITLGATAGLEAVTVWVRDEGIGIPQEDLEQIFFRFYRVDDSDRRIPGGIGLGLALVRELVLAHQGRVWAESIPGEGSTFYFTLPTVREQPSQSPPPPPP